MFALRNYHNDDENNNYNVTIMIIVLIIIIHTDPSPSFRWWHTKQDGHHSCRGNDE